MASEDFYDILGVSKNAPKAEIKKAFRAKAKQHHPDKGGDEATFKKLNEAYNTLSDDQKRTQYDQFGSAGANFGGAGAGGGGFNGFGGGASSGFGGFEDVFSSFFGGGSGGQTRTQSSRGADLEVEVDLKFEESINGVKKTFSSRNYESCESCDGKGGSGQKTCDMCHGTGAFAEKIQTPFGVIQNRKTCGKCHGTGKIFENVCKKCGGEGRVEKKGKIDVTIPAGVENGMTLRVSGKGDAGKNGAARGDLFVHIRVHESLTFHRRNLDLITILELPILDALTGKEQEIETFWGPVMLTIPENIREGQMLRITGKGVKSQGKQGDHLVKIRYKMPKKITDKLREQLEVVKKLVK